MPKKQSPEYQAFKKTTKKISDLIKQECLLQVISREIRDDLARCLQMVEGQLENYWKTNLVAQVREEELNLVKKNLQVFLYIINERPITQYLRDLIGEFSLLIFNWNQMIAKSGEIDQLVKAIDRLLRGNLMMVEAIEIFKRLLERLNNLLNYSPPSFELARHYLQELNKKFSPQVCQEAKEKEVKETKKKKRKKKK